MKTYKKNTTKYEVSEYETLKFFEVKVYVRIPFWLTPFQRFIRVKLHTYTTSDVDFDELFKDNKPSKPKPAKPKKAAKKAKRKKR